MSVILRRVDSNIKKELNVILESVLLIWSDILKRVKCKFKYLKIMNSTLIVLKTAYMKSPVEPRSYKM